MTLFLSSAMSIIQEQANKWDWSNSNSSIIVISSMARFAITINWVRTVSNCELIAVLWFMRWPMPDSNRASRLLATVGCFVIGIKLLPKIIASQPQPPSPLFGPKIFHRNESAADNQGWFQTLCFLLFNKFVPMSHFVFWSVGIVLCCVVLW